MREIRTLRATWWGLERWCGSGPLATPARQPSTLLMSGDGKRGDGQGPQATAPILDSTVSDMGIAGHRRTILLYKRSISPPPGGAS
jgi:hypothetical protein